MRPTRNYADWDRFDDFILICTRHTCLRSGARISNENHASEVGSNGRNHQDIRRNPWRATSDIWYLGINHILMAKYHRDRRIGVDASTLIDKHHSLSPASEDAIVG